MKFILRSAFWLCAAYIVFAPAPQRAQATAALVAGAEGLGMARSAGCLAPLCTAGAVGLSVLLSSSDAPTSPPKADPMHGSSADPAPVPRTRPAWKG